MNRELKEFLDEKVEEYNRPLFIENDPVCIPHLFSKKQDVEIAGFFAAIFSWGNRTTIINKSRELMLLMDNAPYKFCLNHNESDLKSLLKFKHRTFNTTDLLYFIAFLKYHYGRNKSLESAFLTGKTNHLSRSHSKSPYTLNGLPHPNHGVDPVNTPAGGNLQKQSEHPFNNLVETSLNSFYHYFFSLPDVPPRTKKHIASPEKNATCKRLNMFLRWMVRRDNKGVDFGLWKKIPPSELICPVDVHVARVARHFKLLDRTILDWQAAQQLTSYLRTLDATDPVKYDFALFGLGVVKQF